MDLLCLVIENKLKQKYKNNPNMQVPSEILEQWQKNLGHGDLGKIKEQKKVSYPTLQQAFKGEASEDVIIKITEYFKEKAERIANLLK